MRGGVRVQFSTSPKQEAANPTGKVQASYLELIEWNEGGKTNEYYLLEMIQYKWRDIGQLAGLSKSQLESIATKHQDKPIECCRAVLGEWLENPPKEYPITWDGLIELLEDCGVTSAVKELKIALTKGTVKYIICICNHMNTGAIISQNCTRIHVIKY